jgi:hypothetical protein
MFEELRTSSPPALDPAVTNGITNYAFDSQKDLI